MHPEEGLLLNDLAWDIATREDLEERDLDLAEQLARKADQTLNGANADVIDTVARVFFLKGQREKAVEFQRKDVDVAEGERKKQFEATLNSYKEGKIPKA